jgi:hypothetical protein
VKSYEHFAAHPKQEVTQSVQMIAADILRLEEEHLESFRYESRPEIGEAHADLSLLAMVHWKYRFWRQLSANVS